MGERAEQTQMFPDPVPWWKEGLRDGLPADPEFDGEDYEPARDDERLKGQLRRIFDVVKDGCWHTLAAIAKETRDPPASISAQLRHLRKPRFGGFTVDRKYVGNGVYRYRVTRR